MEVKEAPTNEEDFNTFFNTLSLLQGTGESIASSVPLSFDSNYDPTFDSLFSGLPASENASSTNLLANLSHSLSFQSQNQNHNNESQIENENENENEKVSGILEILSKKASMPKDYVNSVNGQHVGENDYSVNHIDGITRALPLTSRRLPSRESLEELQNRSPDPSRKVLVRNRSSNQSSSFDQETQYRKDFNSESSSRSRKVLRKRSQSDPNLLSYNLDKTYTIRPQQPQSEQFQQPAPPQQPLNVYLFSSPEILSDEIRVNDITTEIKQKLSTNFIDLQSYSDDGEIVQNKGFSEPYHKIEDFSSEYDSTYSDNVMDSPIIVETKLPTIITTNTSTKKSIVRKRSNSTPPNQTDYYDPLVMSPSIGEPYGWRMAYVPNYVIMPSIGYTPVAPAAPVAQVGPVAPGMYPMYGYPPLPKSPTEYSANRLRKIQPKTGDVNPTKSRQWTFELESGVSKKK